MKINYPATSLIAHQRACFMCHETTRSLTLRIFQSHILGTVLDAADVRLKLGKQANCQHYTRRNLAVYISRQGRSDMYLHELENSRYILENRRRPLSALRLRLVASYLCFYAIHMLWYEVPVKNSFIKTVAAAIIIACNLKGAFYPESISAFDSVHLSEMDKEEALCDCKTLKRKFASRTARTSSG